MCKLFLASVALTLFASDSFACDRLFARFRANHQAAMSGGDCNVSPDGPVSPVGPDDVNQMSGRRAMYGYSMPANNNNYAAQQAQLTTTQAGPAMRAVTRMVQKTVCRGSFCEIVQVPEITYVPVEQQQPTADVCPCCNRPVEAKPPSPAVKPINTISPMRLKGNFFRLPDDTSSITTTNLVSTQIEDTLTFDFNGNGQKDNDFSF